MSRLYFLAKETNENIHSFLLFPCSPNLLSKAAFEGGARPRTSLTGIPVGKDMSAMDKMWNSFSALGDIAFAYAFSTVLVEIQVNFRVII